MNFEDLLKSSYSSLSNDILIDTTKLLIKLTLDINYFNELIEIIINKNNSLTLKLASISTLKASLRENFNKNNNLFLNFENNLNILIENSNFEIWENLLLLCNIYIIYLFNFKNEIEIYNFIFEFNDLTKIFLLISFFKIINKVNKNFNIIFNDIIENKLLFFNNFIEINLNNNNLYLIFKLFHYLFLNFNNNNNIKINFLNFLNLSLNSFNNNNFDLKFFKYNLSFLISIWPQIYNFEYDIILKKLLNLFLNTKLISKILNLIYLTLSINNNTLNFPNNLNIFLNNYLFQIVLNHFLKFDDNNNFGISLYFYKEKLCWKSDLQSSLIILEKLCLIYSTQLIYNILFNILINNLNN